MSDISEAADGWTREKLARRAMTMGMFEALLLTRCLRRAESSAMDHVAKLVTVNELTLAFDELTAIIVKEDLHLSEDAIAILYEVSKRIHAKPENWHGLDLIDVDDGR
jgi:hypothetical protein